MTFDFPPGFDPQPRLGDGRFAIAPMEEADRDALATAAADPGIWAGHPATTRHLRPEFDRYFDVLRRGGGALTIREGRAVIGCSAYYTDPDAPGRLSIGFTFLTRAHWGGRTNRAVKALMLGHLFARTREAWFHIAPVNLRSQTATTRLGAVFTHEATLDLGTGPARWRCYCLTAEAWAASG